MTIISLMSSKTNQQISQCWMFWCPVKQTNWPVSVGCFGVQWNEPTDQSMAVLLNVLVSSVVNQLTNQWLCCLMFWYPGNRTNWPVSCCVGCFGVQWSEPTDQSVALMLDLLVSSEVNQLISWWLSMRFFGCPMNLSEPTDQSVDVCWIFWCPVKRINWPVGGCVVGYFGVIVLLHLNCTKSRTSVYFMVEYTI